MTNINNFYKLHLHQLQVFVKIAQILTRVFNPTKNYVWSIPQTAIDNSTKLVQHPE